MKVRRCASVIIIALTIETTVYSLDQNCETSQLYHNTRIRILMVDITAVIEYGQIPRRNRFFRAVIKKELILVYVFDN